MKTSAHISPSQHPSLSGWDVPQPSLAQKALCNKSSMVYNLYDLYKPGIWLISPEQGPNCSPAILPRVMRRCRETTEKNTQSLA